MSLNPLRAEPANVDREAIVREDMAHQRDVPVQKLLLTVPEAGRVLAISRSKVYDLRNSGSPPSVYIGRSRRVRASDVETMLRTGERRTEDLVELERIREFAEASDGRIHVVSIDLPPQGAPASNYQPLLAAELEVLGSPADVWREFDD